MCQAPAGIQSSRGVSWASTPLELRMKLEAPEPGLETLHAWHEAAGEHREGWPAKATETGECSDEEVRRWQDLGP